MNSKAKKGTGFMVVLSYLVGGRLSTQVLIPESIQHVGVHNPMEL